MRLEISKLPILPKKLELRDWKKVARDYDELVFDFDRKGDFMPLIWLDDTKINTNNLTFGLYSYLGHYGQKEKIYMHESINCATAVLGATFAGIDKQQGKYDFVDMLDCYYNTANGENMFLNTPMATTGSSFWYEIYPCVLLANIVDKYNNKKMKEIFIATAERWYDCCTTIIKCDGALNFEYTAFSFSKMEAIDNGKWKEPDAAAGIAYILFKLYKMCGDNRYFEMCKKCIQTLCDRGQSPLYELLLPYGAYVAARLNCEYGCNYNVEKILNFCFNGSNVRKGWGMVSGDWGEYSIDGLIGSQLDANERWDIVSDFKFKRPTGESGYAFTGNTFAFAGALLPLVKYSPNVAKSFGIWLLNLANSARLFYKAFLPKNQQSCAFFRGDSDEVIAYEGLKKYWDCKSPYATGDPIRYSWGAIDLGLYGSSFVGFLGGAMIKTDVEGIICWDASVTDICSDKTTYLLFNPYPESKVVSVNLMEKKLKSSCGKTFIADNGCYKIELLAECAIILTEEE